MCRGDGFLIGFLRRRGEPLERRAAAARDPVNGRPGVPPPAGFAGSPQEEERPRHITLSEARSRLYRRRSLQVNSHFAAFF